MKRLGLAFAGSLLCAPALAQLAEYGIEGLWTVSTRAPELRAATSPDGRWIAWASQREGGAGGWDLWLARREGSRWVDARPLPLNTAATETEPAWSGDGRWLYFASDRPGGAGGLDLYRVALADGVAGAPEWLGTGVNTAANERAPLEDPSGRWLLYAGNGPGGEGGDDLRLARRGGGGWQAHGPVPGINTPADELDAAWLDGGRVLLFSRGSEADGRLRLWLAACDGRAYAAATPWSLSFNGEGGLTRAPVVDAARPADLLVSGTAPSPRAGAGDIYRVAAPSLRGQDGCLPPH